MQKSQTIIRRGLLPVLRDKWRGANRRLLAAMICYCILALVALIALTPVRSSDEKFLLGMALFVIVFLAVKTLAHSRDR